MAAEGFRRAATAAALCGAIAIAACDRPADVPRGALPADVIAAQASAEALPDESEVSTPRAWLGAMLAAPDDAASAFARARAADAFEYRPVLSRAVDGDEAALRALLDYAGWTTLSGDAAEEHAAILVALLELWGDEPFAAVLTTTPPAAVAATHRALLSAGASRERFPATFAVPVVVEF